MMLEVSVHWLRLLLYSLSLQPSFNSITSHPNSENFLRNTVKPANKMFVVFRGNTNYYTERLTVTTDLSTVNVIVVISPLVRSAWS